MTSLSTRFLAQPKLTKPTFWRFAEDKTDGVTGTVVEGINPFSLAFSGVWPESVPGGCPGQALIGSLAPRVQGSNQNCTVNPPPRITLCCLLLTRSCP